jgi:arginyl-tRNA synthetase
MLNTTTMQLPQLTLLLSTAWQTLADQTPPTGWSVSRPESWQFGEFTSNIAMVGFPSLSADLRANYSSPRALAEALVSKLPESSNCSFSIAGPGFINIRLTDQQILSATLEQDLNNRIRSDYQDATVLVEFTDPNPFKEFHIGHLYSNIVGESIARLLEYGGAKTHRVCYQGDVGMHVAKSIWGLQQKMSAEQIDLDALGEWPLPERIKFLGQAYALGATAYEEDVAAATEIKDINFLVFIFGQEQLIQSQQWQPQVDYRAKLSQSNEDENQIKQLYLTGRSWSLDYFETIYQRLGTHFEEYFFESLVGELGLQLVRDGQHKQIFIESQGAVIYPGSQKNCTTVFLSTHKAYPHTKLRSWGWHLKSIAVFRMIFHSSSLGMK